MNAEQLATVARIVALRESGLTWGQVEEIIYPGSDPKKGAPKCGPLCKKAGAAGAGAFEKRQYGAFTHFQITERLRPKVVPMVAAKAPQQVEMFI